MQRSYNNPITIPEASPSLLMGRKTACLLLHSFTCNPEEMQFLAEDLHKRGYTVLNARLAGHGTHPADLSRIRWIDWLLTVEDGLDLLRGIANKVVLIGQSMGGMVALVAATKYPLAGVVTLSTPYYGYSPLVELSASLLGFLGLSARKQAELHATLKERREADYPAYGRYPVRIIAELSRLSKAMRLSVPQVRVPCLVIQSHADMGGGDDLERIYASLGSTRKERLWLNGMDHSLVRDPKRQVVFDAIGKFIREIDQT